MGQHSRQGLREELAHTIVTLRRHALVAFELVREFYIDILALARVWSKTGGGRGGTMCAEGNAERHDVQAIAETTVLSRIGM